MAALKGMHWLVADPSVFDLHKDHNKFIFLFDPLSVVTDLRQTTLRIVLSWDVHLLVYNITCVHIKGPDNAWADLLGSWSAPAILSSLVHIKVLPSYSYSDCK